MIVISNTGFPEIVSKETSNIFFGSEDKELVGCNALNFYVLIIIISFKNKTGRY